MSAALGEGLKRLVPEGKYQSTLATEWVDLWSKRHRGTPVPSVETVEAPGGTHFNLETGLRYMFF